MLPYDGVPDPHPTSAAVGDSPATTTTATTSAWEWNAQYGLYFNRSTQQWAKPLPDGSWEYADAVPVAQDVGEPEEQEGEDGRPVKRKRERRRLDRDDPRQEDETYDAAAAKGAFTLSEEDQTCPGPDDPEDDPAAAAPDPFKDAPLLRLVVLEPRPSPSVLPPAHQVASLDPGEPVSIGRDKSFERRIRLKELAISKSHATLFYSPGVVEADLPPQRQEEGEDGGGYWAVVDNASTHGTFVRSEGEKRFVRLSKAKTASTPHKLHHLEWVYERHAEIFASLTSLCSHSSIRCGSTTFSVHIHPSFACSQCSVASDSSNLIPLVTTPSSSDKSEAPAYQTKSKEQKEQERREQMAGLKAQFLKPNGVADKKSAGRDGALTNGARADPATPKEAPETRPAFVDRAANRRQRDAGASAPVPNALNRLKPSGPTNGATPSSPFFAVPGATSASTAAAASSFSSPQPQPTVVDPFASDSRGAQLLSKLGYSRTTPVGGSGGVPGDGSNGLGSGGGGGQLGKLIEARTALGGPGERRAGLGRRELVVGVENVAAAVAGGGRGREGAGANGEKRDWRDEGRERSWKRFREA